MYIRNYRQFFGDPLLAKSDLVAIGGDFSPERLLYAYMHGIFPWSVDPICWYCLDPRAIFDLNNAHFSKTVLRKVKQQKYKITFNRAFEQVMHGCAYRPKEESWITLDFIKAYTRLHHDGYGHSVEAWDPDGNLVGGVYGIAIGKFFAGESMFSFAPDAGKVALSHLFQKLKENNFSLFDTQQINAVTFKLGAYEISKKDYLERLKKALTYPVKWKPEAPRDI